MIVADSSALVSVVLGELDAQTMHRALLTRGPVRVSAAILLETSIVVEFGRAARRLIDLDATLEAYEIEIVPFDAAQLLLAR